MTLFGVHTALENCTLDEARQVWTKAETLGYDWVSIWDHLQPAVSEPTAGSLDAVVSHAALATATERVRVGSLVYSVAFHHPAILARSAATIDHLCDGRMELGIGAGWFRGEFDAFGVEFEAPATRLRRLREAVHIIELVWKSRPVTFEGEFYRLDGAIGGVRPVQEKPRIWIGAQGEQLGLKVAASVNSGWNCSSVTPEAFRRKRNMVLDAASDPDAMTTAVNVGLIRTDGELTTEQRQALGTSSATKSVPDGMIIGTIDQITDEIAQYVDAGADMVVVRLVAPFQTEVLDEFAECVIPQFAAESAR